MESTLKIVRNRDHEDCPVIKIVMPLSLHDKLENPVEDVDEKDVLLRDFLFKRFSRQTNQWFKIHSNFSTPNENPTHTVSTIKSLPQEILSIEFQGAIIDLLYSAGYENSDERFNRVDDFFNWLNGELRGKKPDALKFGETKVRIDRDIHSQEYFNAVTGPVIELLNTYHPHHSIIIDCNSAELLEGKMVYSPRINDPKIRKMLSEKSLRYIFEMQLPEDARMAAFQNTPKHKWDDEVETVIEGIKGAFDWAKSPEGYDYWKKVATKASNFLLAEQKTNISKITKKDVRYRLEMLPQDARKAAFDQVSSDKSVLNAAAKNTHDAIYMAFKFATLSETKEGEKYWLDIIKEADKEYHVLKGIDYMCEEYPETHDKWEDVKAVLIHNRKNL